jgi:phospholipid transport system substrate-binding protein
MQIKELILKRLFYIVVSLLLLSRPGMADDKMTARELLKTKLDAVILVLQNKEIDPKEKNKKIIEIVSPVFDFNLMAKLALGRKHWSGLPAEKKEKYTDLFVVRLKQTYLEKINLYTDETITFYDSIKAKRKVHIPTDLISKGNRISMLYKFYQSKKGWKIYDIEVEGVSIISTFRSQFKETLSSGTIDDLIHKLEKPQNQ